MPTYECDDFRLTFTRIGSGEMFASEYRVGVEFRGERGTTSTFRLPMTSTRFEELVVNLGRSGRREVAPQEAVTTAANAATLGGELGDALFGQVIGASYLDAQRTAAADGKGVRLTLSLGATPELLSVPWELLYRRPRFLASQRHTPVVRYLEVGDVPPPLPIEGPVRVLGVVASPNGLTPLDVVDERARVEQALKGMIDRGLVELQWCDPATRRSLRVCLGDGVFHILHFVGHSDFDASGDGAIYLLDKDGGPDPVNESVLTTLLGDQTSLRLVVLNSCKGARTTLTDPFSGIATALVELGLPAVVAMQFSISDAAAIVFAEELFTSLIGRQYPIDAAVSEARKAVFAEVSEIEWATPVLFLRAFDGRLFDFTAEPEAIPLKIAPMPVIVVDDPDPASEGPEDPAARSETSTDDSSAPTPAPVRRSRRVLVIGAITIVAAIIGGLVWFTRRDVPGPVDAIAPKVIVPVQDEAATLKTVSPTTTLATTTLATTTLATAPSPPVVAAACAGEPLPPRPPLTGLSPEFDEPYAAAQRYIDLIASAQPGVDNSALSNQIVEVFPNGPIQSSNGLAGYVNMEASYLLPVAATTARDGSTTLDVAALVYDNATGTSPCRTGFLCSEYVVASGGTITGFGFTAAPPMTKNDVYVDGAWFAPTDLSPAADGQDVSDWFVNACRGTAAS